MKKNNRIRVHLDTGRSIDGILIKKTREYLFLADAKFDFEGIWQSTGTIAYIPRKRIEWAQDGSE